MNAFQYLVALLVAFKVQYGRPHKCPSYVNGIISMTGVSRPSASIHNILLLYK